MVDGRCLFAFRAAPSIYHVEMVKMLDCLHAASKQKSRGRRTKSRRQAETRISASLPPAAQICTNSHVPPSHHRPPQRTRPPLSSAMHSPCDHGGGVSTYDTAPLLSLRRLYIIIFSDSLLSIGIRTSSHLIAVERVNGFHRYTVHYCPGFFEREVCDA